MLFFIICINSDRCDRWTTAEKQRMNSIRGRSMRTLQSWSESSESQRKPAAAKNRICRWCEKTSRRIQKNETNSSTKFNKNSVENDASFFSKRNICWKNFSYQWIIQKRTLRKTYEMRKTFFLLVYSSLV